MNLLLMVKYVFITHWWPVNKLEWYKVIILSMHTSGIVNSAVSFSGVAIILIKKESDNIYLSANISTFWIVIFVWGNLFWAKNRYMSLNMSWLGILPIFLLHYEVNVFL